MSESLQLLPPREPDLKRHHRLSKKQIRDHLLLSPTKHGLRQSQWCWRNEVLMLKKLFFPQCRWFCLNSPSKSSTQRRNGPKGHVLSPPDQGDPFYPPGAHQQLSKNTGFPLWRQQQMPFSIFLCQVPDLQSRILKFSGCSITKSSSIWGALCDLLGRCFAPRDHPLSYWHQEFHGRGGKVKLSTCPTATFYFPATSLPPAINPDWIYTPYTNPRAQLMAGDTTNGWYIPLGSSPDSLFLQGKALQSCQWDLGAAEQLCVTLVFHMPMCGLRWEKPQKVMYWTIITSKKETKNPFFCMVTHRRKSRTKQFY